MKMIKDACIGFLSLFNYPYISKKMLNDIKGPLILHISDTPEDIYGYIFRIVDILKPKYIIHTGDMADNIKLENYKNRVEQYSQAVKKLVERLEENKFSKIYYAMGNHDDYETVSRLSKRGVVFKEGVITIDDCNIAVGHYYKEYSQDDVSFNLYGHSFIPGHHEKNGMVGLNGLLNINIIDLYDKRVFHLIYPVNTNVSRRMELNRIGI